jgi:hypothetical protein
MQTDATSSVAGQTQAGSVVALWRYPVKSMMGEEVNSSAVMITPPQTQRLRNPPNGRTTQ